MIPDKLTDDQMKGLRLLREPFPPELISKLPKPTKQQNECPPSEKKNCNVCGGWHHPRVIHLDYVGHAALTDRLLSCDPMWNWDPVAVDDNGIPVIDKDGGMWIRLTVCGVSRLGYGDSGGKTGANATKERIGDALRNAAMRFGAALDLWSKADLTMHDSNSQVAPDVYEKRQETVKKETSPLTIGDLKNAFVNASAKHGVAATKKRLTDSGFPAEAAKIKEGDRLKVCEILDAYSQEEVINE